MKLVKKRKKLYLTSKEASKIAWGITLVLTSIYALNLIRDQEDVKTLLISTLLILFLISFIMKNILRVERRKDLEKEKKLKNEMKKILSERKKVKFSFDYFDEECEDFIIEIIKEMELDYYAHIENGGIIIEIQDSNGNIVYQKPISCKFFDENFYLE